jgi:serine/threonine protein kinase
MRVGQRDRIHQEIRLLMTLDHPGVVKLVDVFVTPSHILIVTERAMGGDVRATTSSPLCPSNPTPLPLYSLPAWSCHAPPRFAAYSLAG